MREFFRTFISSKIFYYIWYFFYFSIPFLADTIYYDLFYKEKEEKDFIVSSPVPENEKWQYWHKVNYSDDAYFYIPTPFTFYTGNQGEVNNGEKSWVE